MFSFGIHLVSLGERQNFLVQVSTGRNSVIEGSLSITALTDGLLLPILPSLPCTVESVDKGKRTPRIQPNVHLALMFCLCISFFSSSYFCSK